MRKILLAVCAVCLPAVAADRPPDLSGPPNLIVDAKTNANLVRGAKNLAKSQWLAPEGLNVYDILRHDTLVLTQEAAKAVTEALKPKAKVSNA